MPEFTDILDEPQVQQKRFSDILDQQPRQDKPKKAFDDILDTNVKISEYQPELERIKAESTVTVMGETFPLLADPKIDPKLRVKNIEYEFEMVNGRPTLTQVAELAGGAIKRDRLPNIDTSKDVKERAAWYKLKDRLDGKQEKDDNYYIDLAYWKIRNEVGTTGYVLANLYNVMNAATAGGYGKFLNTIDPETFGFNNDAIALATAEAIRDESIGFFHDDATNMVRRVAQGSAEAAASVLPFMGVGSVVRGAGVGAKLSGIMSKSPTISRVTAKSLNLFRETAEKEIPSIIANGIDNAITFGTVDLYSQYVNNGTISPTKLMSSLVTGGFFPTFSKGIEKAFEIPARRLAFKEALKGVVGATVVTTPDMLVARAEAIKEEQGVGFLTALGRAAHELGEKPEEIISHAVTMSLLSASGVLNRFTKAGQESAEARHATKTLIEKYVNGDITQSELETILKQFGKKVTQQKVEEQLIEKVEAEVPKKPDTKVKTEQSTDESQKAQFEFEGVQLNKGDVVENKMGYRFEVIGLKGGELFVKKPDGRTGQITKEVFKDAEYRKVEQISSEGETVPSKISLEKEKKEARAIPQPEKKASPASPKEEIEGIKKGEKGISEKIQELRADAERLLIEKGEKPEFVKKLSDTEIVNLLQQKGITQFKVGDVGSITKAGKPVTPPLETKPTGETLLKSTSEPVSESGKTKVVQTITPEGKAVLQVGVLVPAKPGTEAYAKWFETLTPEQKKAEIERRRLEEQKEQEVDLAKIKPKDEIETVRVSEPKQDNTFKVNVEKTNEFFAKLRLTSEEAGRLAKTAEETGVFGVKGETEVKTIIETLKSGLLDLEAKKAKAEKAGKTNLVAQYEKQIQDAKFAIAEQEKLASEVTKQPSDVVKEILPDVNKFIAENFSGTIKGRNIAIFLLRQQNIREADVAKALDTTEDAVKSSLKRTKALLETPNEKLSSKEYDFKRRLAQILRSQVATDEQMVAELKEKFGLTNDIALEFLKEAKVFDEFVKDRNTPDDLKGTLNADLTLGIYPKVVDILNQTRRKVAQKDKIRTLQEHKDDISVSNTFKDIATPDFLLRNDPVLSPIANELVENILQAAARTDFTHQLFKEISKQIGDKGWIRVTKAMREKQDISRLNLDKPDPILKLDGKEKRAAEILRQYLDIAKDRIISDRLDAFKDSLDDKVLSAVNEVIAGEDVNAVFSKYKFKSAGKKKVLNALKEIRDIQSWGVEDYITNIELGNYKLLIKNTTKEPFSIKIGADVFEVKPKKSITVAISSSRTALADKLEKFVSSNPNIPKDSFFVDTEFNPNVDFPTQVSRRGYYRIVNKLAKAVDETASEVRKAVVESGAIRIKPSPKWFRALEKRHYVLTGEENIMDVLPYYITTVEKKLAIDPVVRKLKSVEHLSTKENVELFRQWIQDAKGKYGRADSIVDGWISAAMRLGDTLADLKIGKSRVPVINEIGDLVGLAFDAKPFAYSRLVKGATSLQAHIKLGYRLSSALFNFVDGHSKTWQRFGTSNILNAKRYWKNNPDAEKAFEREIETKVGLEESLAGRVGIRGEHPLMPLGLFQKAEIPNRLFDAKIAYVYAVDKLKMSHEKAVEFAAQSSRINNFLYSAALLPKIMRNPTGRLLLQFKSYLIQEAQRIVRMSKGELQGSSRGAQIGRLLVYNLGMTGVKGTLLLIKSIPVLSILGVWDDIEDWLNREMPEASRGALGFVGVDPTAQLTPQLPRTWEELAGATLSDIIKFSKEIVIPYAQGEQKDFSDIESVIKRMVPFWMYWDMVADAAGKGYVVDERGRLKYEPSTSDIIKMLSGFKPLRLDIESFDEYIINKLDKFDSNLRKFLIDRYLSAIEDGDEEKVNKLAEKLVEAYGGFKEANEAVKRAYENRVKPRKIRQLERVPKTLRPEVLERMEEQ